MRDGVVQPATGLEVEVETGRVRGFTKDGVRCFLGVPFAAPPVGELRWAAPQPARAWNGVRDCTAPPPRCHQQGALATTPGQRQDEDCLYLNITTLLAGAAAPIPVMVWVHGGAFVNGAGSQTTTQLDWRAPVA